MAKYWRKESTVEPPLSGQPRSEGARILEFARISEITIISIAQSTSVYGQMSQKLLSSLMRLSDIETWYNFTQGVHKFRKWIVYKLVKFPYRQIQTNFYCPDKGGFTFSNMFDIQICNDKLNFGGITKEMATYFRTYTKMLPGWWRYPELGGPDVWGLTVPSFLVPQELSPEVEEEITIQSW